MPPRSFEDGFRVRPLRSLGRGGMGEVYQAVVEGEEGFERPAALKIIRPDAATRPEFMRLFAQEARLAALLSHPNVIQVYHFGRSPDGYYLLMEYVDGIDLETLVERHRALDRPVPPQYACYITASVLRALDYAANLPRPDGGTLTLVHCDVAPRNVMLSLEGEVKVGDFGIARAFMDSVPDARYMGRPEYMAPEVLEGRPHSPSSDVFSVGAVLYYALTLHQPFYHDDPVRTAENVRFGPVPDPSDLVPDIPSRLADVVLAALEKEPRNRYREAAQFVEALEGLYHLWGAPPREEALASYLQHILEEEP